MQIKKIIAREGIIVLILLILNGVEHLIFITLKHIPFGSPDVIPGFIWGGYFLYIIMRLLIAFIIWAVKTLKRK